MRDLTKVRLIASDLDGTLLYPLGTQTLKEGTCGLIREWLDLGKIFVASSGRQYANLRNIFEPIKDDIAYICENGCLTVYKGKTISMDSIERPLAEQLSRDILAQDKGELLISCADMQYVIPKKEDFFYHMRDTVGVQVRIVKDISEISDPILKVSAFSKAGETDVTPWKSRYGDLCTVQTSGSDWLDIIPKGVNKATAMASLLDYLGVEPSECMAIGDNDNDAEMLGFVGFPVAMEDSAPSILASVPMKTPTVEELLERMIRINNNIFVNHN